MSLFSFFRSRIYLSLFLFLTIPLVYAEEPSVDDTTTVSTANESAESSVEWVDDDDSDPFESFNRVMFDFNYNYLDKYLLKPLATGYHDYLPNGVQQGIYNFTLNLDEPITVWNNVLQGKLGWAANSVGRFVVNTTIGVLGIFDVAEVFGMPRRLENLADTLGYWGVPDGPYFMLPVLGPSVARELGNTIFEFYVVPNYLPEVSKLYFPYNYMNGWQIAGVWALKSLHVRSTLLSQDEFLEKSLDPYVFVREAYLQHVEYRVYDGNPPTSEEEDEFLDEYLDELD
jgi:phospholipid-binding lipoprotein MlaA